jgi:hypothetical protein
MWLRRLRDEVLGYCLMNNSWLFEKIRAVVAAAVNHGTSSSYVVGPVRGSLYSLSISWLGFLPTVVLRTTQPAPVPSPDSLEAGGKPRKARAQILQQLPHSIASLSGTVSTLGVRCHKLGSSAAGNVRRNLGYLSRNRLSSLASSTAQRTCSRRCAPSAVQHIGWRLPMRCLMT